PNAEETPRYAAAAMAGSFGVPEAATKMPPTGSEPFAVAGLGMVVSHTPRKTLPAATHGFDASRAWRSHAGDCVTVPAVVTTVRWTVSWKVGEPWISRKTSRFEPSRKHAPITPGSKLRGTPRGLAAKRLVFAALNICPSVRGMLGMNQPMKMFLFVGS